jgi:hypothetical protein
MTDLEKRSDSRRLSSRIVAGVDVSSVWFWIGLIAAIIGLLFTHANP